MTTPTTVRRAPMGLLLGACIAAASVSSIAAAASVPSRVLAPVDTRDLERLPGNTHPAAEPRNDQGRLSPDQPLHHMYIVLQRSPEQERALVAFDERQQDPASPDYHHWLHSDEFGRAFGPNDHDIAAVQSWLRSQGLVVRSASQGRISIEFSGTAAQIERALGVEMHRYVADGVQGVSNDRDPSIPRALAPVVSGIAGLNSFPLHPSLGPGRPVKRNVATGKVTPLPTPSVLESASDQASPDPTPDFTFSIEGFSDFFLTPYDFATIYNSLKLWQASPAINGAGVSVAILGQSTVNLNDIKTYRAAFGLPALVPKIVNLANTTSTGFENTIDVEMVSAAAPEASITLVVGSTGCTTCGTAAVSQLIDAAQYVIDNEVAPIVTSSYGLCELVLGSSNNALFNQWWQQGATEGLSIFSAAGDEGPMASGPAATCAARQEFVAASEGFSVNGMASSPYVTAVGGTDFGWQWISGGEKEYWNTTNSTQLASAKGYIPETAWNTSCASPFLPNTLGVLESPPLTTPEAVCNAAYRKYKSTIGPLFEIAGGGGGVSDCTTPTGSTPSSCAGGYAKPTWQTGTGVPADGKRDLPDVALFASYGFPDYALTGTPIYPSSEILFCFTGNGYACEYANSDWQDILMQGNGGTSAATPYWAGIMALIVQKNGGARQGLANPTLYKLHAAESLAACASATVAAGNKCVFYDITAGSTAQPCVKGSLDCVTSTSSDSFGVQSGQSAGTGYDLATGLGSVNIENLVNGWAAAAPKPTVSLSATSLAFPATAVGSSSAAKTVTLKNTGTVAVTFTGTGITLSGTDAAQFSKTTTCGTALFIGASCTVSIEFKPTSTGSESAKLSIEDNASGEPQTVALTGTGG